MRTLVERALAKASKYEAEGNTERATYFLKVAEEAEVAYDAVEGKEEAIKKIKTLINLTH